MCTFPFIVNEESQKQILSTLGFHYLQLIQLSEN